MCSFFKPMKDFDGFQILQDAIESTKFQTSSVIKIDKGLYLTKFFILSWYYEA